MLISALTAEQLDEVIASHERAVRLFRQLRAAVAANDFGAAQAALDALGTVGHPKPEMARA